MKTRWKGQLQKNPAHILTEAGYHHFIDPNTQKDSYTRRLARDHFPRFHIYINRYDDSGGEIDIHLDQKHASYEGQNMHGGEYDGQQVEEENARIQRWLAYYLQKL